MIYIASAAELQLKLQSIMAIFKMAFLYLNSYSNCFRVFFFFFFFRAYYLPKIHCAISIERFLLLPLLEVLYLLGKTMCMFW